MPRIVWSDNALRGVQRHYRFLAVKNIAAARRAAKAIRDGVKILAEHPRIGRPIADMDEAFRDWIIDFGDSGYVVRYRITNDGVMILAVRHQKEAGF
ncbi:MAG: type II toxin-antitoxin system RelE/ParE family toxin [Sulfuritalea sp.]|jgi:plasmid stabilization system protein ParE|nr:type II toxin-antitoxin system RelE/ParE family toxin [Sulfuritalea sp.]MDP1985456.1 type II toxin-antitoxin system RelE/ParE family toxin [Sulfuritalea sp.]